MRVEGCGVKASSGSTRGKSRAGLDLAEAVLEPLDRLLAQPDPRERVERRPPDVTRCAELRLQNVGFRISRRARIEVS